MMFYKETDVKKTPVGEIPAQWEVIRLEEILHLRNGERPRISDKGSVPVFGANGIMGYTNEVLVDNDFSLIVGRVGASGEIHLGEGKIWVSDNAIYSENYEKTKAYLPYLFYSLKRRKLSQFASKTTHPIITQTFLNNFSVHLPPLIEQRAIVGVLGVVDSAVELVDRVIAKTERLKKGLMQTLLTRGIGHTEYKQTPIGTVPSNWETKKLSELCEPITKGTTPTTYGFRYTISGVNFIKVESIDEHGCFIQKNIPHISEEANKAFSRSILKEHDVLFSIAGALGRVAVVTEEILPANTNQALAIIRLKNHDRILVKYLKYFLMGPQIQKLVRTIAIQSQQANINLAHLRDFLVALPPLYEQKKISEILDTIDKKLELERKEKARLERVKRGLMDLLLTGKIRVRVD